MQVDPCHQNARAKKMVDHIHGFKIEKSNLDSIDFAGLLSLKCIILWIKKGVQKSWKKGFERLFEYLYICYKLFRNT